MVPFPPCGFLAPPTIYVRLRGVQFCLNSLSPPQALKVHTQFPDTPQRLYDLDRPSTQFSRQLDELLRDKEHIHELQGLLDHEPF